MPFFIADWQRIFKRNDSIHGLIRIRHNTIGSMQRQQSDEDLFVYDHAVEFEQQYGLLQHWNR